MGYLSSLFPASPPPGATGDPGLFGPGSCTWHVARERMLLAGGPAALLLQLAHPLVAEGVAQHSDFSADPLRRLRGTLDATLRVTFGDAEQARQAAHRVGVRHRPVTGRLRSESGTFAAGTPYRANDPDLARWVHATLVWTALHVHNDFVESLTTEVAEGYSTEMATFGRLFGVQDDVVDVEAYFADMLPRLHVGPQTQALADEVLAIGAIGLPRPLGAVARLLTRVLAAGLLPPQLRDAYRLPWRRRERVLYAVLRRSTGALLPLLPARARFFPHYRVACRRVRGAAA